MAPWRKTKPKANDYDLIRLALTDVVTLIAEPSGVVPLEGNNARSNCEKIVMDFLDHNEAELALEHLIYVINEADLAIGASTFETIESAASLIGMDALKYRAINPKQQPINTLDQLRTVTRQTYTLAVKLLSTEWVDTASHSGPFRGAHLAELAGGEATPLLELLNQLEPATQARCHTPRHSLVMWGPDLPVSEVALCFRCNNARTRIGNVLGWISFDGKSSPARELLEWIELIEQDRHDV